MVAANFLFSCSSEVYWMLIPFAITPLMDLITCFGKSIRRRYGYLIYAGYLFPIWLMLVLLHLDVFLISY